MQRLAGGAPSCSISREDAKEFEKLEGHCFGFSAVWLYSKWLQFVHSEKVNAYNSDWYKSTVTDILDAWSDCDNIKKFASLVKKLHNSVYLGTFEKEMNQLDTNGKKLQKEYSIASLFTLEQLEQLLREIVIYDHKLILITSHNHLTALFKDGDNYYYFNSNSATGEYHKAALTDVANLIFLANAFDLKKLSPLALQILSFDEKTPSYPDQQEVLDRIRPSLVAESNYADERTGLHQAAFIGCPKSVRYFLSKGVDINQIDTYRATPLWLAAQNGHLEIVQLLIEKGADINAVVDDNHRTALMLAAQNGHLEVLQLLIEKGADINAADSYHWTVLMAATLGGYIDIVKLLLENGADPDKKNNYGYRAIDIAMGDENIVKVLKNIKAEL